MQTGQYIQDGTVKWIVTDVRDGDRVGDITFHPNLLPGHIKANRANWTDASVEIPRLLAWVQANNMLTTDSTDESKYLYDSENDILTLPNVMDRVLQGGNAVETKQAGLPNILSGTITTRNGYVWPVTGSTHGLISGEGTEAAYIPAPSETSPKRLQSTLRFDASTANDIYGNSQTVQPPAIVMIPQIKY